MLHYHSRLRKIYLAVGGKNKVTCILWVFIYAYCFFCSAKTIVFIHYFELQFALRVHRWLTVWSWGDEANSCICQLLLDLKVHFPQLQSVFHQNIYIPLLHIVIDVSFSLKLLTWRRKSMFDDKYSFIDIHNIIYI